MKDPSAANTVAPIILGYAFMVAGIALGTVAFKRGLTSPAGLARNPVAGLFLTGMWLGLLLGGLGLVYHGSFVSGLITSGILLVGGILGAKRLPRRTQRS